MKYPPPTIVIALLGANLLGGILPARPGRAAAPLSFNRDVRPILSDKCFFCHGPEEKHRAADLRLDLAEDAHEYAIVPGDSGESELIARILDEDPDVRMPPPETGKRVTPAELAILRRWIEEGAEYEPYWAYVPPLEFDIPRTQSESDVAPPAGPIDDLVRSSLGEHELKPSPRASRRDQLRRLSLDLTGLPARFEDIQAFRKDSGDAAYERWVDRYLASPAFGERFAEYWMDLVRFADTVGYHGDQTHNIAPYRDYVIDSINDGKGLDQFSIEQLAGDLLADPTIEQQVASGYNRLLQTSHEGGVQPKEYLAIYAADRVRNFSAVWMAATVGCAQCHDHKYDPYTAEDFYSLVAFFADIDESQHFKNGTNSLPTKRFPEIDVLGRTDRVWLEDVEAEITVAKADGDSVLLEALTKQRDEILSRKQKTMVTKTTDPRTIRYLPRGNWLDDSGDVMQPRIPDFLGELSTPDGERPTRLELARWLFDVEQGIGGLTARVFANRLWYLYTGRGISSSLGDFGGQGTPPSNPELLDHLARVLIESDWDIKRTVRAIVTSETYRQAVSLDEHRRAVDPYNDYASGQSGHRLPAETVRDVALEMAGLLDHRIGGPSARPYQPAGYYRHLNFPQRKYQPDDGAQQWRRGLYTHWQRQFLHPMMKALDAPSREECTAVRPRSNTPLEALVLLNDPTFVTAASALAARVMRESSGDSDRIDRMLQLAVGRNANEVERVALTELLTAERKRYGADAAARESFVQSAATIAWPDASVATENAAWASVARAVINLHETLYRP